MDKIVASEEIQARGELSAICRDIASRGLSDADWSARESCDEFQTEHFCGGYEAAERAFCFSLYLPSGEERWLTISLHQVGLIASGTSVDLQLRFPR